MGQARGQPSMTRDCPCADTWCGRVLWGRMLLEGTEDCFDLTVSRLALTGRASVKHRCCVQAVVPGGMLWEEAVKKRGRIGWTFLALKDRGRRLLKKLDHVLTNLSKNAGALPGHENFHILCPTFGWLPKLGIDLNKRSVSQTPVTLKSRRQMADSSRSTGSVILRIESVRPIKFASAVTSRGEVRSSLDAIH